jgi:hypothetical protein
MRMMLRPALLTGALLGAWALLAGVPRPAAAQVRVRVTFQPDCFRPSLTAACDRRKTGNRLDLGPQIAVWIEKADRSQFVDTLLVTNLVALRGLGNRPGAWNLPSSPKFPYGKRPMALPVWAHARGKLYDTVIMQDGIEREYWLGFHELISSPDPYYCRPMSFQEIDVDAVTCPTATFNSAKGRFAKDGSKTPYPPRADLRNFTERDCDEPGGRPGCTMSARMFSSVNDLDAVATPTPVYGQPYTKLWTVPAQLPDGEYALFVETSKEFDGNPHYTYVAFQDPQLTDSGMRNNIGQPSVVYKVPFTLSRTRAHQAAATEILGYGDWDGKSGTLHPPDHTISDTPGSGKGRLLVISRPALAGGSIAGRVHVVTEGQPGNVSPAEPVADAGAPGGAGGGAGMGGIAGAGGQTPSLTPDAGSSSCPVRVDLGALSTGPDDIRAETALLRFTEPPEPAHGAIEEFRVHVWEGSDQSEGAFRSGIPMQIFLPTRPGEQKLIEIRDLKPEKIYTAGLRAAGACVEGGMTYVTFTTKLREFTQLSGCFIATAAYGSPMAKNVDALRRLRDAARSRSAVAGALVDAYERSSPPVAHTLGQAEEARAVVRTLLAPLVEAARAVQAIGGP